eukprot:CAMPEP_0116912544 /NCGR_PEP_ID=MMETSP0467-20121206/16149_1 /TAXON_ID=283647 /ORGANISM="Mesodinium pulex, Strain SPMC105" /LENGTH=235 /DNA_ID=CAMNT_0004588543 /DNA_START=79 /DNA_END=786 /DNA_ORIENTATION=+
MHNNTFKPFASDIEKGSIKKSLLKIEKRDIDSILSEIQTKVVPGLTHWQHKHFHAWFPSMSSSAAVAAEMLIATFNVVGFSWESSPVATEMESFVMDHLIDEFALGDQFKNSNGGYSCIMGTASEAILTCQISTKKKFKALGVSGDKLACIFSNMTHYCSVRGAKLIDIENIYFGHTYKNADISRTYNFTLEEFKKVHSKCIEEGNTLGWVTLTFGTTATASIDEINEIAAFIHE